MDLAPIVVLPSAPHTHTIVFLHGRGDTAATFSQSLQYSTDSRNHSLQELLPSFRWVFPKAPIGPCLAFPTDKVSQWFDIWNVKDFSDHEDVQAPGLSESVARIRQLLTEEAALLGGRWDRIVLAGISQGAATATHALLNLSLPVSTTADGKPLPRRLGAYLGFSCRMPFPGRSLADTRKILGLNDVPADNEVLRNTPILLEHCVDDPLVLLANGQALRETLKGFGAQVAWNQYPDGGHWFNSPRGMDDVVAFLTRALGQSCAAQGPPADGQPSPDAMDLS
ncbi:Acyl-protein thioesterase 1 [Tolypocladium ophioglossoides CBS 100239]|uniref:Acyl-protein thioesterase 1 n=1 Tax=Tolypocladium ophioglossoides (strain CBS 100239) TaxID=1163406 RepID=A0A0L0NIP1_TOLOC|nr:Acyl-protein thioesterase 1 [Tolypocladium ophioglossoides CBS 100239]